MISSEIAKTYVPVKSISSDRYSILQRAITNILCTSLALETFAQVVDGRPLGIIAHDYGHGRRDFDENTEPSKEARAAVEEHRKNFDLSDMQIEDKVYQAAGNQGGDTDIRKLAQAYQDAEESSKQFSFRLMETLSVLLHDVAVFLFNEYDGGIRKAEPPEPPKPIRFPDGREMRFLPPPIYPTDLFHSFYQQLEQYPNGVADIVGYWVEYRLFGGVVLFDRGESGTECNNAFIHPVRGYRIFQVSDQQLDKFIQLLDSQDQDFLENGEDFRFKAERTTRREDPWDAMHHLNIYRDRYERKIPERKPFRCVVLGDDYPELQEQRESFNKRKRERPEPTICPEGIRSKMPKIEEPSFKFEVEEKHAPTSPGDS